MAAELGGRLGREHAREPGMTTSPGGDSARDRAAVILTPDQRVRVFVSSTLEERAALRAIRRLHLVPVWYESGARLHPPRSMYRAYLEQSQIFVGIYWQRCGWWVRGWRSRAWRKTPARSERDAFPAKRPRSPVPAPPCPSPNSRSSSVMDRGDNIRPMPAIGQLRRSVGSFWPRRR